LGAPSKAEGRRVSICRTYRTISGERAELASNEALLRFVTRHAFGHVLGWEDSELGDEPNAMVQGLAASNADALGLDGRVLDRYDLLLAPGKPRGTLVTTTGACLSRVADELVSLPCSDPRSGRFELTSEGAVLLGEGASECLASSGSSVTFEPCEGLTASSRFTLERARWSTPARCVAPYETRNGSAAGLFACRDIGDAAQAWRFDIQAGTGSGEITARLHFETLGACLTRSSDPGFLYDVPTLEPCDTGDPRQVFVLYSGGVIGAPDGPCLTANRPDGALHLFTCAFADVFWLSGALRTSGGHAITARNGSFVAEALDSVPGDAQVFDFSF
jgi:hypothetical protein